MPIAAAIVLGLTALLASPIMHLAMTRHASHQPLRGLRIHCLRCGTPVEPDQRIPILTFLARRNRCHTCRRKLWTDAPWLEVFSVALLAFAGWRFGFAWALPAFAVFFLSMIVITVVDYRQYIIPNRTFYPTLTLSLILLVLAAIADQVPAALRSALVGMTGSWLFFMILYIISPKALGRGDVRLISYIGLVSGWLSPAYVVLSVIMGLVVGSIGGLFLMLLGLRTRKQYIPFGPFLITGAFISILFGGPIIDWWASSG